MFPNQKIYMLGIGGVSMSGIAMILKEKGNDISGYDHQKSSITENLEKKGIIVDYKDNMEAIKDANIIVYTAAISDDNPLLVYAKKLDKIILERSTFLGQLMKLYDNVICISGTHGKSTTTGMVSSIFMEAGLNPTISIGANLPLIEGNVHVGGYEYFIVEACEYVDSFLEFNPTSEIILNIDDDHLDYFKNIDNIITSFNKFSNLLPSNGYLVINNDDENTKKAVSKNAITYGIENESDFMAKNITFNESGHASYDLYNDGNKKETISLMVSGMHNVYNSLAAIALCAQYNIDYTIMQKALEKYAGVGRRFEYLGKCNNAFVYDDYAHHPSEIKTTLSSVKNTNHNESWAIFQSHTYSRTKEHLDEFASILKDFDHVIIAKIYPAREKNTFNVHEEDLVELIKKNGNENVLYIESFDDIIKYIKENVKNNDLVITIGAGPVNEISKKLVE